MMEFPDGKAADQSIQERLFHMDNLFSFLKDEIFENTPSQAW